MFNQEQIAAIAAAMSILQQSTNNHHATLASPNHHEHQNQHQHQNQYSEQNNLVSNLQSLAGLRSLAQLNEWQQQPNNTHQPHQHLYSSHQSSSSPPPASTSALAAAAAASNNIAGNHNHHNHTIGTVTGANLTTSNSNTNHHATLASTNHHEHLHQHSQQNNLVSNLQSVAGLRALAQLNDWQQPPQTHLNPHHHSSHTSNTPSAGSANNLLAGFIGLPAQTLQQQQQQQQQQQPQQSPQQPSQQPQNPQTQQVLPSKPSSRPKSYSAIVAKSTTNDMAPAVSVLQQPPLLRSISPNLMNSTLTTNNNNVTINNHNKQNTNHHAALANHHNQQQQHADLTLVSNFQSAVGLRALAQLEWQQQQHQQQAHSQPLHLNSSQSSYTPSPGSATNLLGFMGLYVGNLSPDLTKEQLEKIFSKYGEPIKAHRLIRSPVAFIKYENTESPRAAIDDLFGLLLPELTLNQDQPLKLHFDRNDAQLKANYRPTELPPKADNGECYGWRTTVCRKGKNCPKKHIPINRGIDFQMWMIKSTPTTTS